MISLFRGSPFGPGTVCDLFTAERRCWPLLLPTPRGPRNRWSSVSGVPLGKLRRVLLCLWYRAVILLGKKGPSKMLCEGVRVNGTKSPPLLSRALFFPEASVHFLFLSRQALPILSIPLQGSSPLLRSRFLSSVNSQLPL